MKDKKVFHWFKSLHDIQLFDLFKGLTLMHLFEVHTLNCIKYSTKIIWYFSLFLLEYYGTFSCNIGKCTNRKKYQYGTFS